MGSGLHSLYTVISLLAIVCDISGLVVLSHLGKAGPSIHTFLSAGAAAEKPLIGRSTGCIVPGAQKYHCQNAKLNSWL